MPFGSDRKLKNERINSILVNGKFGESSLRYVVNEYVEHYHKERCHQGLGNVIPLPNGSPANDREGPIECQERLGGLLKYYRRKAA